MKGTRDGFPEARQDKEWNTSCIFILSTGAHRLLTEPINHELESIRSDFEGIIGVLKNLMKPSKSFQPLEGLLVRFLLKKQI